MQSTSPYNEDHLLYLQKILKVSRKEIIETIRLSRISSEEIVAYIKKKNLGFGNRPPSR